MLIKLPKVSINSLLAGDLWQLVQSDRIVRAWQFPVLSLVISALLKIWEGDGILSLLYIQETHAGTYTWTQRAVRWSQRELR